MEWPVSYYIMESICAMYTWYCPRASWERDGQTLEFIMIGMTGCNQILTSFTNHRENWGNGRVRRNPHADGVIVCKKRGDLPQDANVLGCVQQIETSSQHF
jgi:hypothetical protein